mgnify:FL=1
MSSGRLPTEVPGRRASAKPAPLSDSDWEWGKVGDPGFEVEAEGNELAVGGNASVAMGSSS